MGNAAPYYQQGLLHFNDGDYDGAIGAYNIALYYDPKDVVTLKDRGDAQLEKGELGKAVDDYTQAVELDPLFARAFSRRAYAKVRSGDLSGALIDCEQALALDLAEVQAYSARALARARQGDVEGALEDAEFAVGLDPYCSQAISCRAYAKMLQGDREGALADCRACLRRDPRDLHARAALEHLESNVELSHSGPEVDLETSLVEGSSVLDFSVLDPSVAIKPHARGLSRDHAPSSDNSSWLWCSCASEDDCHRISMHAEISVCGNEALPDVIFAPLTHSGAREALSAR